MATIQPTLAGFLLFVRNTMGISTAILPDNSPVIGMAFAVALAIVNPQLKCAPALPQFDSTGAQLNGGGLSVYALAVYNLAGDNLLNYAQDLPDAEPVTGSGDPGLPFFAWTRKQLNINGFVSGVIQSSGDNGTSVSLVVQEAAKDFTLANLQQLKTPYGRQYLAFAQSYGPTTWGIS
jgi:hypothetical protein